MAGGDITIETKKNYVKLLIYRRKFHFIAIPKKVRAKKPYRNF